jgi:hypothetical protein
VLVVLPTLNLAGGATTCSPTAGYGSIPALPAAAQLNPALGPRQAQGALTRGAGAVEPRTTSSVGRT